MHDFIMVGCAGMAGLMRVPCTSRLGCCPWGSSVHRCVSCCVVDGNPGGSPWVGDELSVFPARGGDASGDSPGCQPGCLLTAAGDVDLLLG